VREITIPAFNAIAYAVRSSILRTFTQSNTDNIAETCSGVRISVNKYFVADLNGVLS
jgi:regulator of RNase E activity RraA